MQQPLQPSTMHPRELMGQKQPQQPMPIQQLQQSLPIQQPQQPLPIQQPEHPMLIQQPQQSLPIQQPQQPLSPEQAIYSLQPQVFVIPAPSEPVRSVRRTYAAKTSKKLGVIQIFGGISAIALQAILTGLGSIIRYYGTGFWCGIFVSNSISFIVYY